MYTAHHSMTRHQSQQDPRRTKWDTLSLACQLRGIAITRGFRRVIMHTPEGVVAECRSIAEALETYRNDIAFHGLPVIAQGEE